MNTIKCLARSLRGHDRGEVYAVCREDEQFVFLADGKSRTLAEPKKKNRRHVQIIRRVSPQLSAQMDKAAQDSDIVHILRLYRKENENTIDRSDTDQMDEEVAHVEV